MMPAALGAPVEVHVDDAGFCGGATSHGSGVAALSLQRVSGDGETRLPYAASGSAAGSPMSSIANRPDVDTYFHPVTNGFRGIVVLRPAPGALELRLRTWDLSGGLVSDLALPVRTIAPLPDGGSVAVLWDPAGVPGANPSLAWIDASGGVTRTVPLDNDVGHLIVNWPTGHVFAFVGGTSARATQGRWYDGAGTPLTPWFVLPLTKGSGGYQRLLADGVVALGNQEGPWLTAVRDGVAGTEAVPAWLAARPDTRLVTIRGGRGYAVLPVTGSGAFEIATSAGESCGIVTVPQPGSGADSAPWSPARLDVGWDGSVFQTFLVQAPGSPSPQRCVFRWWPGVLQ